jgi:nucleoid-associated protein YgaU
MLEAEAELADTESKGKAKAIADAVLKARAGAEAEAAVTANAAGETQAAHPPAAAEAAQGSVVKHTVVAGETLSHISLKYYKTANRWKEIYEANKDVIGPNANLIKAGQVLVIPNVEGK